MTKRFFKSFLSSLLALLMVVSLAAVPSSAATVKISKSSFTLTKGYCTTLSVTGTTSTPTWSTGNKSVATVSSKGKVVGRGVGSTYIYAKVNGKTLKSKVTVVAGKISVGKSEVSLDKGDSTTVRIKAIGTHTISVSSSNKSVVKATWNGAKFNGDYITLTLKAVGVGTAKVKVYAKNYPKTIYKYINVTVEGTELDDDDTISDDSSSEDVKILSSVNAVKVNESETSTFNVYTTASQVPYLKAASSNVAVASVSMTSDKNGMATIKVTGVRAGNANIKLYFTNNTKVYANIPVTVTANSTYYNIVATRPTKLADSDYVIEIRIGVGNVKYMLVPFGYDVAYVNTLIAKNVGYYNYYDVYDSQPVKKTTKDEIVSKTVILSNGQTALRYILAPENYDTAKVATRFAKYSGSYEYYVVYTEKPEKMIFSDEIKSWTVEGYNDSTGKIEKMERFILLPFGYDEAKFELIKKQDEDKNQIIKAYTVLDKIPSNYDSLNYELISWYNDTLKENRYMLVPRFDCDFVMRNDVVRQDTGVYCYYVAYSTQPTVIDPEIEAVWSCRVPTADGTSSRTVYILYNPKDSDYADKIDKAISGSDYIGVKQGDVKK